jgi:hypothetical protein
MKEGCLLVYEPKNAPSPSTLTAMNKCSSAGKIPHKNPPFDYQQQGIILYPNEDSARKRQRRHTAGDLIKSIFKGDGDKKRATEPRPMLRIEPRAFGPVHDCNPNDVLCGRGGRINAHRGNVQLRELVHSSKKEYLSKSTKKMEKAHIAANIVHHIRSMNPPGRFLKEDSDGAWFDIGDHKAIKKVGQALREDAPVFRQGMGKHRESSDGSGEGASGTKSDYVSSGTQHTKMTQVVSMPDMHATSHM